MASPMGHFPDPRHLTASFSQLLQGVGSVQKMIGWQHQTLYFEKLFQFFKYINRSLLIKYFIVSTCDLFARVHVVYGAWGGVVVKALRYWSEGPGIDLRSLGIFFRSIRQFHVPWGRLSL
jgi:hypothetical protein